MESRELAEELAEAAWALHEPRGERDTLDVAVGLARRVVRGCTAAGIWQLESGRPLTSAATDDLVRQADRLQEDLGEGPCLSARRDEVLVASPDLASEQRWPRWAASVRAELGLASMMSVQLYTGEHGHGALNVYSTDVGAFDDHDHAAAIALGAQIAVALATARRDTQLSRAAQTRNVIGQAQGILVERYGLTAEAAFAYLTQTSQRNNTKLYLVARTLVRTGDTPDPPPNPAGGGETDDASLRSLRPAELDEHQG